ncbi:polysaccharide biosynthesis C-terminal domain-containing protein [Methylobacterium trifolii]|uniref:dTDP-4-dehydrorhamnose 3,5-epimerase n=1 Tax=Methylobacterium trifolii TaxID=1003092 RepID=A0ABQ4U562_9HYPH|nr:dTDP-4-dehydrorhamnose 3,5-epimerase family protein [Methylobacterium trifolii]GJE61522.1 hypothetical protein MPOCJGCO_3644 [Methylobacterium trifolii]
MLAEGTKDTSTVTASGERIERLIDGVILRYAVLQTDERGEITEIFDPAWGVMNAPLVYVYAASVRPGRHKGWVYHKQQSDRMFVLSGFLKIVLYDLREDSPTKGMINEINLSERKRGLIHIPPHVAHLVQNVGDCEAYFVNMPDRPYDHADPDKFRIAKDRIPYSVAGGRGW